MDVIKALIKEMETEGQTTRKMLERVPAEKFSWKPHEKSMTLQNLAVHVAELPGWVRMAFSTSELDFAKMNYTPTPVADTAALVSQFDAALASGLDALKNAKEEDLEPQWTLRTGNKIHMVLNKYELVRHAFAQTTHHRAQLGVYLRLLNVPIPGSYGPSADETDF